MPICPKHDVPYQEGHSCWCCDQAKKKPTGDSKDSPKPVATGGK